MELELSTLQLVKSIRTADFNLYLETIEQLPIIQLSSVHNQFWYLDCQGSEIEK